MSPEYVVAVDLGGTLTKIGTAGPDGAVGAVRRVPTGFEAGAVSLDWLAELIGTAARGPGCRGYSVVVPGIIEAATGVVRAAPNVGWVDLPLRAELDRRLGRPGAVGHDVRAAGLAEWRLGAAAGCTDALIVILGTGVAAAAVVDSRLLDAGGYAGELGHLPVPAATERDCACGLVGCLETVCSAVGLRRSYAELSGRALDAHEVTAAARQGDPAAVAAVALAIRGLSEGLAVAATLLGPELVVIGGGLVGAYDLLHDELTTQLQTRLSFQRMPRLATAALGADAGLVGAGLLGWAALDEQSGGRQ